MLNNISGISLYQRSLYQGSTATQLLIVSFLAVHFSQLRVYNFLPAVSVKFEGRKWVAEL